MDINELKEYVDAKIYENGRQEITGNVLNGVFHKTIDTLDAEVTAEAKTREEADEALSAEIATEASDRETADTELQESLSAVQTDVTTLKALPIANGAGKNSLVSNNLVNKATGDYSHSEGDATSAGNRGAHAEGASTTASAIASHAEGESTTASARGAHSEGYNTTASGKYTHAEGNNSKATAEDSHAEGGETEASGRRSHAEGGKTIASNQYSHAEGFGTTASGSSSHAEGSYSSANGNGSHAENYMARANGDYAHAEGSRAHAEGKASHAEGEDTVVSTEAGHAQGKYNEDVAKAVDMVGIGTADNARKNAELTLFDGKKYVINVGGFDGTSESIEHGAKSLQESVNEVASDLLAEMNARVSADASLASQIDTNAERLEGAISAVEGKITEEASARESADTDLQSQITAETEARTTADTALRTDVDELKYLPIAQGSARNSLVLNDIVANQATGKHSTAEGKATSATKTSAHSEGSATTASGDSSHSEGHSTVASGVSSHSEGLFTQTATQGGHSQGMYNEDDTDAIHTIGIGTSDTARKNSEIVYTNGKKYLYGVGGYDGTKSSIASGAKSIQEVLNAQATTGDIDTLTTAVIAPYTHNAGATISGTLPDGVTSADRFRLEVLPLGDSYVEQRLTVPTNGSVAVYTRVYDGSSWGDWV